MIFCRLFPFFVFLFNFDDCIVGVVYGGLPISSGMGHCSLCVLCRNWFDVCYSVEFIQGAPAMLALVVFVITLIMSIGLKEQ